MNSFCRLLKLVMAVALLFVVSETAHAALSYNIGGSWDTQARRDAATAAMQAVVDRYNAYGNFGNYNIYVYYNAGIPTAQASYLGSIGFGGTWPNERVTMHELAHYLGSGTYGTPWDGGYSEALVDQFDGLEASLNGDNWHFWPYGLNYDSEGSEINKQRQVALVYAQRADMGIGPSAHPSKATNIALTASNPVGESGFNFKGQWSDGYFAHAGADYFTGNFALGTPSSSNSFTFAGDSLTVNNTSSGTAPLYQGLCYRGTGTTGIIKVNDLRLDGGWIQHVSAGTDLFQLDGNIDVRSPANIRAKQGRIDILANVHGDYSLTIHPSDGRHIVRMRSADNSFTGDLVNLARFELSAGANFTFALGASGVNNAIKGDTALATLLNGVFELDDTAVDYAYGNSWQLVSAAATTYGATFSFDGFISDAGLWRDGSFTFDQTTGLLTATPGSDLNSDGLTNLTDWLAFNANHLTDLSAYTPEQRAALGDLNGDGANDYLDFRAFKFQYDALNGAGAFAAMLARSAVPEPGGLALSMLALLLVLKPRDSTPWVTRK